MSTTVPKSNIKQSKTSLNNVNESLKNILVKTAEFVRKARRNISKNVCEILTLFPVQTVTWVWHRPLCPHLTCWLRR